MSATTVPVRLLVETTFSACGHTARVPQTTAPARCPHGCDTLALEHRRPVIRPRSRG
ncbi:hypothetical protein [Couchioplanes caeruleus]|uniref:Uncharacterized protein n=1 Tax=Couchioplanes caeruleus TaxID=56438 RepID=A0A3N1GBI1_9ACTN|nr:hypothetical protein [Couchioplanes caeruleus]ROP27652.1 hypothetical protein EDD30_0340 [Couchioplanes caeruleus]